MAFCEQCGARLEPDSRFCTECGAVVVREDLPLETKEERTSPSLQTFTDANWRTKWAQVASGALNGEYGIILTREAELLSQVSITANEFHDLLAMYISASAMRGISYAYLDLQSGPLATDGGGVASVVAALSEISAVARPKYLFIIGNETVVDVARWDNLAGDVDKDVPSDLCYSTLCPDAPWIGQVCDFNKTVRVGRIPTFIGESSESFSSYFSNAVQHAGKLGVPVPYGLSALVWEEESNDEYRAISPKKVDVSPEVDRRTVRERMDSSSNLLFFNLHGSDQTRYWYGQSGNAFPEAFAPDVLIGIQMPYFLGVEACYGARYLGGLTPHDSIVLMALRNKCLSFLASSRIAYGRPRPQGTCADIVIGEYIKYCAQGQSAGDAHHEGLKQLTSPWNQLDDTDFKTLAEFSLYGDPSIRMREAEDIGGSGGVSSLLKGGGRVEKGLPISMPDVRRSVTMALAEVNAKIEVAIDEYVMHNLLPELLEKGLDGVSQTIFKMSNTGLNQKIYSWTDNPVRRIAKVYFDDNGRICKAVVSK